MPELPEVETIRRGLTPHLQKRHIVQATLRHLRLRWPIPEELPQLLPQQHIHSIARRGKYLLIRCDSGSMIWHMGMSGRLYILPTPKEAAKHDHVDLQLDNGSTLRYTDPRRFGALLWTEHDPLSHPLLRKLGPEPLSDAFNPEYLYQLAQRRTTAIKTLIMNSQVVVGVGNIYAAESLFMAGIHPNRPCNRISYPRIERLCAAIKNVLQHAIDAGGTTLKDFVNGDGKPGYFQQQLFVYGKQGEECVQCQKNLILMQLGQRSTVYCPQCQR